MLLFTIWNMVQETLLRLIKYKYALQFYLIDGGEMQVYVAFETGIEIIYSAKPR